MIRKFNWKDINKVMEIELNSFPKIPYNKLTFFYLSNMCEFIVDEEDGGDDVGGDDDRHITGYIIFGRDGHIISMAVHPSHRRRGVGKRLMGEVFKFCSTPYLEVRRSNKIAISFYESIGFKRVGIIDDYYGCEDGIVMKYF